MEDNKAAPLSPREMLITSLVAKGLSNDEIAKTVGITKDTARLHITRIYRKMGFEREGNSRVRLTIWYLRNRQNSSAQDQRPANKPGI